MKSIFNIIVAVFIFSIAINAQVLQQVGATGSINWQDQIIRSTGIGAPNPKMPLAAQRAGAIEAAKNSTFEEDPTAPELQRGTISYTFILMK